MVELQSPQTMKGVIILFLAFMALAAVVVGLFMDILSERGGHEGDILHTKEPFATKHMSRSEYIAYLMRTERHDDPELWLRIEAVKKLKDWPQE